MAKKYLLSSSLITEDIKTYVRDYIQMEFDTQKYSVPSGQHGFNRVVDGVDSESLRATIFDRISSTLNNMATYLPGVHLAINSVEQVNTNEFTANLKLSEDEFEVNISV